MEKCPKLFELLDRLQEAPVLVTIGCRLSNAFFTVATVVNRPAPAILLALHFFLCMHDSGHTHQVKHRIRYATSIGQTHSSCICTRKASWDEQGTIPRECTQLCLGQPELPGIGMGDHAIWEFNEGQESPCSSKTRLAVTTSS